MTTENSKRKLFRDGFGFTSIADSGNGYDAIFIMEPGVVSSVTPRMYENFPKHTLDEYVEYINREKIEKAYVVAENIDFIRWCPTLHSFNFDFPDASNEEFDFSPLYEREKVVFFNSFGKFGRREEKSVKVDFAKMKGIERISIVYDKNKWNIDQCKELKYLDVASYKGQNRDLSEFCLLGELEELFMSFGKNITLNGLGAFPKLKELTISKWRSLEDISALYEVKDSLTSLKIDTCGKIKDFSVLQHLHKLESLWLLGNNEIPNLGFLKEMKNLKFFAFSFNVLDGDLSACMNIDYCGCSKERRHYNFKNKDFQKIVHKTANIPL